MRVVFFGTPSVAVVLLRSLALAGHEIPLVVTRPDRPAGRSSRPIPPPVSAAARSLSLPVVQPSKVRSTEFLDLVTRQNADVLVVAAYGRILPAAVLSAARLCAVNVHFSLLPAYRGAAPVQWALARCETHTGVTTMKMNEALDEGDILLQEVVPIHPDEHAAELQMRLAEVGAGALEETLGLLESGDLLPRPQDHVLASYAPPLTSKDGEGDLTASARELEGRVRGFDPWPGVWVRKNDRRLRIAKARARDEAAPEEPGRVLAFDGEALVVTCGGGSLLGVFSVQPEGRGTLTARDAFNGRVLLPGDRLEGGGRTRT